MVRFVLKRGPFCLKTWSVLSLTWSVLSWPWSVLSMVRYVPNSVLHSHLPVHRRVEDLDHHRGCLSTAKVMESYDPYPVSVGQRIGTLDQPEHGLKFETEYASLMAFTEMTFKKN